jgi:hypothetical protein
VKSCKAVISAKAPKPWQGLLRNEGILTPLPYASIKVNLLRSSRGLEAVPCVRRGRDPIDVIPHGILPKGIRPFAPSPSPSRSLPTNCLRRSCRRFSTAFRIPPRCRPRCPGRTTPRRGRATGARASPRDLRRCSEVVVGACPSAPLRSSRRRVCQRSSGACAHFCRGSSRALVGSCQCGSMFRFDVRRAAFRSCCWYGLCGWPRGVASRRSASRSRRPSGPASPPFRLVCTAFRWGLVGLAARSCP